MTEKTVEAVSVPTKACTRCLLPKPATLEYFHRAAGGKYGVKPTCKECLSQESRAKWAKKHVGKKKNIPGGGPQWKVAPISKDDPVILVKMDNKALIATLQAKIDRLQAAIEVIREIEKTS